MRKISAKFTGQHVLVVEDNLINQEVIKDLLELMDCKVDIADNGLVAIEMAAKRRYAIIFMDIQMPDMDGYDSTRAIRKKEEEKGTERTTIIALTANALSGDREKCLAAGMDDYLSKPIDVTKLESIMLKYLLTEKK